MTLLATGVKFLKNPDAIHYLEIICYQGNGWLKHISLLLAVSGSVSVFTGIFRVCVIQLKTSQETLLVSNVFSNMNSFSFLNSPSLSIKMRTSSLIPRWTQIRIPTPYFCKGLESESESVP